MALTRRQIKNALSRIKQYKSGRIWSSGHKDKTAYQIGKDYAIWSDDYLRDQWRFRVVQRWLEADDWGKEELISRPDTFQFDIKVKEEWKTIKASRRGYGWKFIQWEPFEIYGTLSNIKSDAPIRNFSLQPRFRNKDTK
jgi:hypothetical protein